MQQRLSCEKLNGEYINAFLPEPVPCSDNLAVIGSGAWGDVIDLGDGTVLKLLSKRGGIGDVWAKLENEAAFLARLSRLPHELLSFPKPLGHGRIPDGCPAAKDGFVFWARNTKIRGGFLSKTEFNATCDERNKSYAITLGQALAHLHGIWDRPASTSGVMPGYNVVAGLEQLKDYTNNLYDKVNADGLIRLVDGIPESCKCIVHGDVNITNVAVKGGWVVSGLVDFAESGWAFPEMDFSHVLVDMPRYAPMVLEAYLKTRNKYEEKVVLDRRRLSMAKAINALFGAVISEFIADDAKRARTYRSILTGEMAKLEIMPEEMPLTISAGHG